MLWAESARGARICTATGPARLAGEVSWRSLHRSLSYTKRRSKRNTLSPREQPSRKNSRSQTKKQRPEQPAPTPCYFWCSNHVSLGRVFRSTISSQQARNIGSSSGSIDLGTNREPDQHGYAAEPYRQNVQVLDRSSLSDWAAAHHRPGKSAQCAAPQGRHYGWNDFRFACRVASSSSDSLFTRASSTCGAFS